MKVVYGPEMAADLLAHFSPSSGKPRRLTEHLQKRGYPLELHSPLRVTPEQLCLAHHPDYVSGVLSCEEFNGFDNRDPDVAASLPYTTGSLWRAAQLALEHGLAASFSSGFHHAFYDVGGGYCTFNGLVVCARLLQLPRLLILDLDYHYGDGTDQILQHLGIQGVRHETFGAFFRRPEQGEDYLRHLEEVLASLQTDRPDLILFQAGADVHVEDPLGGVLTTEQMGRRDRMVFAAAHRLGIPLAWNLAGGYQRDKEGTILPVLRLHEQTYRAALEIYQPEAPLPGPIAWAP